MRQTTPSRCRLCPYALLHCVVSAVFVSKHCCGAPRFLQAVPAGGAAAGVAVGAGLQKAVEFVKGGPQKMQQMAMEQMMKQASVVVGASRSTATIVCFLSSKSRMGHFETGGPWSNRAGEVILGVGRASG